MAVTTGQTRVAVGGLLGAHGQFTQTRFGKCFDAEAIVQLLI